MTAESFSAAGQSPEESGNQGKPAHALRRFAPRAVPWSAAGTSVRQGFLSLISLATAVFHCVSASAMLLSPVFPFSIASSARLRLL